jgi:hypothetical protein
MRCNMRSKLIVISSAVAGCILSASGASAATVLSIGYSIDGAATVSASPSSSINVSNPNYSIGVQALTAAPSNPLLESTTLDMTSLGGSHTLDIWVTVQNLTAPTGTLGFLSAFDVLTLPTGWTLTEETFIDNGNGQYTTVTPLSSEKFTGPVTSATGSDYTTSATTSSDYSLTEEYVFAVNGAGTTQDEIRIDATPLPATLPLFASGLGLLGFTSWRKRRKNTAAALPLVAA